MADRPLTCTRCDSPASVAEDTHGIINWGPAVVGDDEVVRPAVPGPPRRLPDGHPRRRDQHYPRLLHQPQLPVRVATAPPLRPDHPGVVMTARCAMCGRTLTDINTRGLT